MLVINQNHMCSYSRLWNLKKRAKITSRDLSFSSSGKISVGKLPYSASLQLLLRGDADHAMLNDKNFNIHQFTSGSTKGVETVSRLLSKRDIAGLSTLVTNSCFQDIRENVLEKLRMEDYSRMAVNSEDIFLRFITNIDEEKDGEIRITVVNYSLPGMESALQKHRNIQATKNELAMQAQRSQGILRKEDINVRKMRKAFDDFDDGNIGEVLKEKDILITEYTFANNLKNNSWKIVQFSHADSIEVWGLARRLIWKARIQAAVNLDLKVTTYLRYEYVVLIFSAMLYAYLQYLAISIGAKYEKEFARRQLLGEPVRESFPQMPR